MKQIQISVSKNDIFKEVSLKSAYTGVKSSGDSTFFERVAVIKEDEELLTRFWKECSGKVSEKFRTFINTLHCNAEKLEITLEVSCAFDDMLAPSVESDIRDGIAMGVLAGWFKIVLPDSAHEYAAQSDILLSRAFSKLCHRKRPLRK